MKALKTTIALGLLFSMPVQADVVCQDCTFDFFTTTGGYLGAYWPGDRGTFHWDTVFTTAVNTYWVVDLNANGTLVFQGSTPISAQFKTLRAELYADWGSVCDPAAGGACNPVSSHPEIMDCTVIDYRRRRLRPGSVLCRSGADGPTLGLEHPARGRSLCITGHLTERHNRHRLVHRSGRTAEMSRLKVIH